MKFQYELKKDVEVILEAKNYSLDQFCDLAKLSKRNLLYSFKSSPSNTTLDKAYSAIYSMGFRLTKAKSEIFEELYNKNNTLILYHGSKFGVEQFTIDGSRETNDFGKRLYLTQKIDSATSFIESYPNSSIYAFKADFSGLSVLEFGCDLDWMIAVSYYRGKIDKYKNDEKVKNIIQKIESSDLIIAPIADNKMFDILNQFADETITTEQAFHCLSASRLGKQFVIFSQKALDRLNFIERLYLSKEEKESSISDSFERSLQIQTKLDFAKRNFRDKGKYIDEVLKCEN